MEATIRETVRELFARGGMPERLEVTARFGDLRPGDRLMWDAAECGYCTQRGGTVLAGFVRKAWRVGSVVEVLL